MAAERLTPILATAYRHEMGWWVNGQFFMPGAVVRVEGKWWKMVALRGDLILCVPATVEEVEDPQKEDERED